MATGGRYDPLTDTWTATTATDGAPSARSGHSAVWTGSEMIVWGGVASGLLNTGGRYDPAADAWGAATATSGAPSARIQHSAVWADGEMIVWGGTDSITGTLDSGARYDPDTDTWGAAVETSGAPVARHQHSAVWTGSQMIVWGGLDAFGTHINSGGRYDPASNAWADATSVSGTPSARRLHSAIWTGGEMIVWGGFDGNDTLLTGGRYDPLSNSWGAATATGIGVPGARYGHGAIWTGSEMIVWGGGFGQTLTNDGSRHDPAVNAWGPAISAAAAPSARRGHSAVWTGTEMIVWGGLVDLSGLGIPANSGGRYNPASNTWGAATSTVDAPVARSGHSAIWTGSEMIVWGGSTGFSLLNSGGRYDPIDDSWGAATTLGDAPSPRDGHSAIWTGSEMIVWGGSGGTGDSGARYDPATDSWGEATSVVDAPSGRSLHSAVWTGSEMIVWGGSLANPFLPPGGGRFDPASNAWGEAPSTVNEPSERRGHSAIWTGRAMIVWGGLSQDLALADMHLYFPYATASITSLDALAPSPSLVGGTVAATVRVASPDRAPVDGTVTVTASSGESCSDDAPLAIDALTVEFTCTLVFASAGTRDVSALFSNSSSHDDSASAPLSHAVRLPGTVVFGPLAFIYDGSPKAITATLAEDATATCTILESPIGPNAGDYPVTASCEGDTHIASGSATASIARAGQAAFSVTATPPALLLGQSSTLGTLGGSGDGAVSFELTDGEAACSLDGSTLTALAPGDCSITASKAADANYLAASASVIVGVLDERIFGSGFEAGEALR